MLKEERTFFLIMILGMIAISVIGIFSLPYLENQKLKNNLDATEDVYLEVIDKYRSTYRTGGTYTRYGMIGGGRSTSYHITVDAFGEKRDIKANSSVFEQVKVGDNIKCRIYWGKSGEMLKVDIILKEY